MTAQKEENEGVSEFVAGSTHSDPEAGPQCLILEKKQSSSRLQKDPSLVYLFIHSNMAVDVFLTSVDVDIV